MKINKKTFLEGIKKINLIKPNKVLPITGGVRITTTNNGIKLSVTDLESELELLIEGIVQEQFDTILEDRVFIQKVLTKLKSAEVEIEYVNEKLILRHDKGVVELPCSKDTSDYPTSIIEGKHITASFNFDFAEDVIKASNFSSKDELRPTLCGVCVNTHNGNIEVVSTDAYELIRVVKGATDLVFSFIIPSKYIKLLEDGIMDIYDDYKVMCVKNDTMTLYFKNIGGNYPNYNAVIPEDFKTIIEIDKKDLIEAVGIASLTPSSTKTLKFDIENSAILSEDVDYKINTSTNVKMELKKGEPMMICFNADNLLSIVSKLKNDAIQMGLNGTLTAVRIDEDNITYIIMPTST